MVLFHTGQSGDKQRSKGGEYGENSVLRKGSSGCKGPEVGACLLNLMNKEASVGLCEQWEKQ